MQLFNITIREAIIGEARLLTKIAFAAKRTWDYPEEYMIIWKDELTITDDYIDENIVFVAERRKQVTVITEASTSVRIEWTTRVIIGVLQDVSQRCN